MEELIKAIRQAGKSIFLTVNNPIILDKPDKIWFIETGLVGLYTVKLLNHEPDGKRFYFTSIEPNQILMGLDSQNSDSGVGFMADAMEESTLYELDLSVFQDFFKVESLKSQVVSLVNIWLDSLFFGISENANHPNKPADVLILADERLILRQGESIASQKEVIWAKIASAKLDSVLINGKGKIAPREEEVLIPLTRRSFFESTRNVGIRFLNSTEALSSEASWLGIRLLDDLILNLEKMEIQLLQTREQAQLQAKYENQFQRAQQSLQQVQAILNPKIADKYAETLQIDTDDALFNACQVVSAAQNIRLTPPMGESNIDPLGDITRASKIRQREVKLEGNWYEQDAGALLGFHTETEEPLALMPLDAQSYEAYNPASKETFRIDKKNAHLIDKLAFTFYKPFPEKKLTIWTILNFGIFKDQADFRWLIITGLAGTLLGLLTPILTGILFDEVIPNASNFQVIQIGIALSVAMLGQIMFELTENYALLRIETKLDNRLQSAIWDRLLNLPVNFFRQFTTGDLAERTMSINEIRKMLSGVVITSVLGSIFSILNFILLFYYSVQLALVAFALVVLQILVMYGFGSWQIQKEKLALQWQGKTQGIVLQLLTGIAKFRVTGTEIRAFTHWLNHFARFKQASFQASQVQNVQLIVNSFLPLLSIAIIYWAMLQSSQFSQLSTGQFLAFIAAYGAFTSAILAMSASLLTIYQVFPIYERTRPILDTLPETDTLKANPGKLKGNIEVNQVNFRYEKDTPLVLQEVSLKLSAGDYVAFVGPSGSGKSSMVRLLLGFEKPESGSIYYDEQELSQLDLRMVRRQIGTVLQDGQLTPGDIFSNIVGSSPHLTLEDAWEAAKLAALDEDIKQMPMGMHTVINEGASTLSGGQKQRLLIAQILVHKPRVLIFDEATSALDNRTQAIVTNSLNKLQATRIVIAHRLSTIQNVDKIFVFDKGRIIQSGTYQELIKQEGLFKDLATRQIE